MKILCHRGLWEKENEKNTIFSFKRALDNGFGVETDVRDYKSTLVVSHDFPDQRSPKFSEVINIFQGQKATLAINIKADGLVRELVPALNNQNFDYFVFDGSIPELFKYRQASIPYLTRRSEFEKESLLDNHSAGIWLDAFEDEWFINDFNKYLAQTSEILAVVSPELHGRDPLPLWRSLLSKDLEQNIFLCTDRVKDAEIFFGSAITKG